MSAATARGALHALATLGAVFAITFLLLQLLPGDPIARLDSPRISAADAERTRHALGLDRPLGERFVRTALAYASGDLGVSLTRARPVATAIGEALPATMLLGAAALALAYTLGLPLAVGLSLARGRSGRAADAAVLLAAMAPRFWLGIVFVLVFHGLAGWLPASHAAPPGGGSILDRLRHLVLPALTLALPAAATIARFEAAALRRERGRPHVRAARAAGVHGSALLARHVLRPSLTPAVALFGLDLPVIVSGAVVVEVVFAWPGLGRLTANAILEADYPLALACSMLAGVAVVTGRVASEALARRIDPRLERRS